MSLKWKMARDVGFEPTRPFDHRLSRPAPYQARAIPQMLVMTYLHIATLVFFAFPTDLFEAVTGKTFQRETQRNNLNWE